MELESCIEFVEASFGYGGLVSRGVLGVLSMAFGRLLWHTDLCRGHEWYEWEEVTMHHVKDSIHDSCIVASTKLMNLIMAFGQHIWAKRTDRYIAMFLYWRGTHTMKSFA